MYRRVRALWFVAAVAVTAFAAVGAGICGDPEVEPTPTADQSTPFATIVATTTQIVTPPTESSTTPIPEVSTTPPASSTASEEPTSARDLRQRLPTPSTDTDGMGLGGHVYVDARPATGEIKAYINGLECGSGQAGSLGENRGFFAVGVASHSDKPGCGIPGATITFSVNGQAANETIAWAPGLQEADFTLSSGVAFAIYRGTFRLAAEAPPGMVVTPLIDGIVCGDAFVPYVDRLNHARWTYKVLVDPEELRDGCGRAGSTVALKIRATGAGDVEIATVPWETLPPVELAHVDLSGLVPTAESSGEATP